MSSDQAGPNDQQVESESVLEPKQAADPARAKNTRRFPSIPIIVVMSVCVGIVLLLWLARSLAEEARPGTLGRIILFLGDTATVNIFSIILFFVAGISLFGWFVFSSGYPVVLRRIVLIGVSGFVALACVGSVAGAILGYVMIEFSGAMIPNLKLAQGAPELRRANREAEVDLNTTTPNDFPQFLGAHRNLTVDYVRLATNWDAQPPKLIWRQPIGKGWSGFAAVNGFAVTIEQRGPTEIVTCYEIETGKLLWWQGAETRHATVLGGVGPRSTPTIHEGKVYALGATGRLWCLDGRNGSVVWKRNLWDEYGVPASGGGTESEVAWGRAASPLIVDNLAIVPAGGPAGHAVSLVAYEKETGEKIWEAGEWQVSYSSPNIGTIAGERQIVIVNEDAVSGHDVTTGDILWSHPWTGDSSAGASASQAVLLPGDHVLLSKAYGEGAALLQLTHGSSGDFNVKPQWHNRTLLKTKLTNVAVDGQYVYGLSDGILECVNWEAGRRMWKGGRYGHGQILLVDNVILVQAESGEVIMVDASPARHNELGRFQAIDGKTWNNLCLYGRYLLVRNAEEAACYELPLAGNASTSDSTTSSVP